MSHQRPVNDTWGLKFHAPRLCQQQGIFIINDGAELAFVTRNRFEKAALRLRSYPVLLYNKVYMSGCPACRRNYKRFCAHGCQMLHVGPLWLVDA